MKTVILFLLAMIPACRAMAQQHDTAGKKTIRLQEIVVVKKEDLIKQDADKIIYDLQADPQSKISSMLDMMRKVPHLSVDAEENILLGGSSAYKIFINGRPSGILNGNPKEVLRSMPASTIKSIEVIINPPARYDAEGLAGIINIVTLRQAYNGYKGTTNISMKGPASGPGAGGSFTLKQAKFGISAITGANYRSIPATTREQSRMGGGSTAASLLQYTTNHSESYTIYGGPEVSYEIDTLNLVSGQAGGHLSQSTSYSAQATALTAPGREQYYKLDNRSGSEYNSIESTINYQRGFKNNKDRLLTVSCLFLKELVGVHNNISLFDEINYAAPDYLQHNTEKLTEHTVQADYIQPINRLTLEGGVKGVFRIIRSDFIYESMNTVTGAYERDTMRSNIFQNKQDIVGVYNSYTYRLGNWQFKAGGRCEITINNGSDQNMRLFQHKYVNLLPSGAINKKLNAHSSLSLSFSTRIQRPAIGELNPFIDRSNPNFTSSGNPYLRPITSNVIQLSYMLSALATLNATVSYKLFNDVFNAITTYDAATNTTLSRYENFGKGRLLRANLSLNYPVTGKLTFTMNSDIRHVTVQGMTGNGTIINNSGVDVYIYVSGAYSFKNGWQVNANITYKKGGILLPVGRTNGYTASSVSINKNMLRSKLVVSASISNPFTKYRYIDETIDGEHFLQMSHKQVYFRRFAISLNYRFGKLKEDIKKNRRTIANDDKGGE